MKYPREMMATMIVLMLTTLLSFSALADGSPYWIFFKDRGDIDTENLLAAKRTSAAEPKNLGRRAQLVAKRRLFTEIDLPVNEEYIEMLAPLVGRIRTISRYFNGVSVELDEAALPEIEALAFVREVRPVRGSTVTPAPDVEAGKSTAVESPEGWSYGASYDQLSMLHIHSLHNLGYRGEGLLIAVLDSGFDRLEHSAFDSLTVTNQWDFVEGDGDATGDDHGSKVLSIMAALKEGELIGAAPYAQYVLARTEDVEGEDTRVEEDYLVAGIEWADSLGVDVVNLSIGYNEFADGDSYEYEDLDGDTALSTIACDAAAERGMIVVTSAGNEGNKAWRYVTVPADGDSVIAVGAVGLDGYISSFSSFGPTADGRVKPDFVALGENVRVVNTTFSDTYTYGQGTSYAAPALAGGIALMLQANPNWDYGDLISAMRGNATAVGDEVRYGYGLVDMLKAAGLDEPEDVADGFKVYDPYPHPVVFSSVTPRIFFPVSIPKEGLRIALSIFDFNGVTVFRGDSEVIGSGELRDQDEALSWDGTNYSGEEVAPGVYFYSIELEKYGKHTGKILVMR